MVLTINFIENSFEKYNVLYFNGLLKKPIFKITNSKRRLGCLSTRYLPFKNEYTLSVSKYYDRTEKQYDNTIIHEMIHLYISQMGIVDNGSHGRVFKQHCARINQYGWNLSRCTDASQWELTNESKKREENRLSKISYNVIVYKEPQGTQFIFRVSNGNEKTFYNHLRFRCQLECKLFKTNDIMFDSLPSCRSKIRGRRILDSSDKFAKYMI